MVLNIHGGMAHSPVVLQAYAAVQQVIAEQGTFDPATREAIALVVGTVDRCEYCQAAHTTGGKRAGLTEEQTVAIRKGEVDSSPSSAPCSPSSGPRSRTWGTCPTRCGSRHWRPGGATPS